MKNPRFDCADRTQKMECQGTNQAASNCSVPPTRGTVYMSKKYTRNRHRANANFALTVWRLMMTTRQQMFSQRCAMVCGVLLMTLYVSGAISDEMAPDIKRIILNN